MKIQICALYTKPSTYLLRNRVTYQFIPNDDKKENVSHFTFITYALIIATNETYF